MSRFRVIDENTLVQPKRGTPAPCPEGFIQEPSDQYVCLRIWPNCDYRSVKLTNCCAKLAIYCMLGIPIKSQQTCIECTKREDGNAESEAAQSPSI